MMKRFYTALVILLLAAYAYAEFRGLDFPTGERQTGGIRGARRSGVFGGK